MDLNGIDRIWFLTWTTYGTWLPGDERGFVSPKFEGDSPERRHNEPGRPYDQGRETLRRQFEESARHRGWRLLAGAIMANHVHLVVGVPGDPDPAALLRDFKSYASRALNRQHTRPVDGTWWTEQGSKRKISDWETLGVVLRYVREQVHPFEVWEDPGEVGKGQGADAPRSPGENGGLFD
jgi:REP element-mobilizing transposase RayT